MTTTTLADKMPRPFDGQAGEPPPAAIGSGSLEALKWLALIAMTLDHANKYLLHGSEPALYAVGRLALPLFTFVLGCGLAQPQALARGVFDRVLLRLLAAMAVAVPITMLLGGLAWGWWPLNILATLWIAVLAMRLLEAGGAARTLCAVVLVLAAGAFVEFWWPAITLCIAWWRFCKHSSAWALLGVVLSLLAVAVLTCLVSRLTLSTLMLNLCSFAALPLIYAATRIDLDAKRIRHLFYVYYPAHLAALYLLRSVL